MSGWCHMQILCYVEWNKLPETVPCDSLILEVCHKENLRLTYFKLSFKVIWRTLIQFQCIFLYDINLTFSSQYTVVNSINCFFEIDKKCYHSATFAKRGISYRSFLASASFWWVSWNLDRKYMICVH